MTITVHGQPRHQVDVKSQEQIRTVTLPPWRVILHNDDTHWFHEVIDALVHSVPLSTQEAEDITARAHQNGRAVVIACPRELAEYYEERLKSYTLNVSIEPA